MPRTVQNTLVAFGVERRVAAEHNIQHHTSAPHVAQLPVSLAVQHLWGDIVRCAYLVCQPRFVDVRACRREPQVDDLELRLVHDEVLRLDVAVHHALGVQKFQPMQQLRHQPRHLTLRKGDQRPSVTKATATAAAARAL